MKLTTLRREDRSYCNALEVLASHGYRRDEIVRMVLSSASSLLTGASLTDFKGETREEVKLLREVCKEL